MSQQLIADRYANAFYAQCKKSGNLDTAEGALSYLRQLSLTSRDFARFLSNPLLTQEEQVRIIKALFASTIPPDVLTFIEYLISKRRLALLTMIAFAFEQLAMQAKNQLTMQVVSAQELDAELKEQLKSKIGSLTKKNIIGQYKVDPSIIGGIRVWADGKLFEYSLANELQDYKRRAIQTV